MEEGVFSSPEEMQQAYDQLWEDLASFFTDIPAYFSEAADFASENPVGIIIVSMFLVLISFFFIRIIISDIGGGSRH